MLESLGAINAIFVLSLSMYLKFRDRGHVKGWIMGFKRVNGVVQYRLILASIFVAEGSLLVAVLISVGRERYLPLAVLGLLAISAGGSSFFSNSEKGCPCFGSIFLTDKYGSLRLIGLFGGFSLLALCSLRLGFDGGAAVSLLVATELLVVFIYGLRVMKMRYEGERLAIDVKKVEEQLHGRVGGVVLFLSTQCHICMRELRLLEGFSSRFKDQADFFFVIDGMGLDEDCIFGGGIALANVAFMKSAFGVKLTPTVVVYKNGQALRYTGLHASKTALYDSLAMAGA